MDASSGRRATYTGSTAYGVDYRQPSRDCRRLDGYHLAYRLGRQPHVANAVRHHGSADLAPAVRKRYHDSAQHAVEHGGMDQMRPHVAGMLLRVSGAVRWQQCADAGSRRADADTQQFRNVVISKLAVFRRVQQLIELAPPRNAASATVASSGPFQS